MIDPLAAELARALRRLNPPESLLVALSGGADSVALVTALGELRSRRDFRGLRVVLGHVRHDIRPRESTDLDVALAERLAERLGFGLEVREVQVTGRGGLEEAARRVRYEALEAMALGQGCGAVLTGHTATDQAETLLLRLVRGAGLRGLGAMAAERALGRVRLLRPMLGLTREEVRAYCARVGAEYLDDATNTEPRPRVRLRTEVLPVLEALTPGAVKRLAGTAERLRADAALLEQGAARQRAGRDEIRVLARMAVPLRRRALLQWCEENLGSRRGLSSVHLEALEHLVMTGRGEVLLPGARRAGVDSNGRLKMENDAGTNRSGRLGRQSKK